MKNYNYVKIKEHIKTYGSITSEEAQKTLDITGMTVNRIFQKLESEDFIIRTKGAALLKDVTKNPDDFSKRYDKNYSSKVEIAKKAASLVKSGDNIFIDSGTTCSLIVMHLPENVNVYTSSYEVLRLSNVYSNLSISIIGGEYSHVIRGIRVASDLDHYENYKFDKSFIGIKAIDSSGRLSDTNRHESLIKKYFMSKSDNNYILADMSKIDNKSFYNFSVKSQYNLITNELDSEGNHKILIKEYAN